MKGNEMSDGKAVLNTDREIWREKPDDFYADSIHVTEGNGIGLNVGGHVIVKPIRDWFKLAELGDGEPSPEAKSFIDLRREFADQEWIPSCYMDDGRGGLLLENNAIVLGVGAGFNYEAVKKMATEHNANLRSGAAQEVSPTCPLCKKSDRFMRQPGTCSHPFHDEPFRKKVEEEVSPPATCKSCRTVLYRTLGEKGEYCDRCTSKEEVSPPSPEQCEDCKWHQCVPTQCGCSCHKSISTLEAERLLG